MNTADIKKIILAALLAVAALAVYRRHNEHLAALRDEEEAHRYSVVEAGPSNTPQYTAYLLRKEKEFFAELDAERYALKCLADHMEQIKDGVPERIRAGRLCWYCKEHGPDIPCVARAEGGYDGRVGNSRRAP